MLVWFFCFMFCFCFLVILSSLLDIIKIIVSSVVGLIHFDLVSKVSVASVLVALNELNA